MASGFKTNPDANADDLLKKMPGITVDGSGVQAQGESVQRVLVDGREFFGDDPTIATKNLGADGVQTVEIYEKENEED